MGRSEDVEGGLLVGVSCAQGRDDLIAPTSRDDQLAAIFGHGDQIADLADRRGRPPQGPELAGPRRHPGTFAVVTDRTGTGSEERREHGFGALVRDIDDQDDPLAKAIHGLLDHAAETDRRLASLLKELEAAGVKCDQEVQPADRFDPKYLSKIVD